MRSPSIYLVLLLAVNPTWAQSAAALQQRSVKALLAESSVLEQPSCRLVDGEKQSLLKMTPTPRGGVTWPSVYARPGTTDSAVFQQIFDPEWQYDDAITKILDFHPQFKPNLIVDAGANCGLAAHYFAHKYPECRIVSIEPDKGNQNQIALQKLPSNVNVISGGVWNNDGVGLKIVDPNADKWAIQVEEVDQGTKDSIDGYTILGALQKVGIHKPEAKTVIDIVKIDIEGGEQAVFSDENVRMWLDQTNVLLLELHASWLPGSDLSFKTVHASVSDQFEYLQIGENEVLIRKELLTSSPIAMPGATNTPAPPAGVSRYAIASAQEAAQSGALKSNSPGSPIAISSSPIEGNGPVDEPETPPTLDESSPDNGPIWPK